MTQRTSMTWLPVASPATSAVQRHRRAGLPGVVSPTSLRPVFGAGLRGWLDPVDTSGAAGRCGSAEAGYEVGEPMNGVRGTGLPAYPAAGLPAYPAAGRPAVVLAEVDVAATAVPGAAICDAATTDIRTIDDQTTDATTTFSRNEKHDPGSTVWRQPA